MTLKFWSEVAQDDSNIVPFASLGMVY